MDYQEIIDLIEKYEKATLTDIKNNIYDLLKTNNLKCLFLCEKLSITKEVAKYYTNQASKGKIPIKDILKICKLFNITIDELMKENNRTINHNIGLKKGQETKWDAVNKEQFIKDVETLNIIEVAKKYGIKEMSVGNRYRMIKNQLNI